MSTKEIGTYKINIGGDEYTKTVTKVRDFLCVDYEVVRIMSDGKRVSAHLNKNVHRQAIRRIETALASA